MIQNTTELSLDSNSRSLEVILSDKNKSCENFSRSSLERLVHEINDISVFLSSGSCDPELVPSVSSSLQIRVDNLSVLLSLSSDARYNFQSSFIVRYRLSPSIAPFNFIKEPIEGFYTGIAPSIASHRDIRAHDIFCYFDKQ